MLLDLALVYDSAGVAFTLHPARKHSANPLFKADQPWEGWYASAFAGTVLFDDQEHLFKRWYTCPRDAGYFSEGTCYATSKDGLKWDKPLVGTRKAKNGKPHNSVSPFGCPSVFHDPADADPARRYKMVCFDPDRGYLTLTAHLAQRFVDRLAAVPTARCRRLLSHPSSFDWATATPFRASVPLHPEQFVPLSPPPLAAHPALSGPLSCAAAAG